MSLPIAIVGIAAQLPSGDAAPDNLDHNQFFDFLLDKGQAYEKIPDDRFHIDSYHGRDAGQVATQRGTFLKGTDLIDHVELGITNKDARSMSLSTRKLIELAFLALLDSGIDYRSQNVGCFASGIIFDVLSLSDPDEFEARGSFGGPPAMIANRISYHLDLTGPSVPVDTACSSSLTATHLAVQAIRAGDCDSAVVGGVQLNHRFVDWVQYSQGGILAPDGTCKPFDAAADGFARGEAGVAIVLKRLDHALRDNDHVYATILGTGINSAGSAAPVNAPVAAAQRDAMRRAWAQTDRRPADVDYVELHATGTAAGDPAEANWVGDAFRRDDQRQLLIGSVKGNIGHTEIAAFLASLAKVVGAFRTQQLPPTVNLAVPNPAIRWDALRLRAHTETEALPPRALVAMCSSGIGGANGHVVLEAPPPPPAAPAAPPTAGPVLLMAGGLSPRTAAAVAETLAALAHAHPAQLPALATLYGRRARQMPWRAFAVYTPAPTTFSTPVLAPRARPRVAFVLAGQGPQHAAMGRGLYAAYPVFRASIDEMDDAYAAATGTSLVRSTGLFAGPCALGAAWPIAVTLPALAMLQCALVDLLRSAGVAPAAVVAHSAGETAAVYATGAGSKALVVELAVARGRAMQIAEESADPGTMAALACGAEAAAQLITEAAAGDDVDVACFNADDAVTIAGRTAAVTRVVDLATARGVLARALRTRVPVHSRMMAPCQPAFEAAVSAVFARHPGPCTPRIPFFSALTGAAAPADFCFDTAYFWAGTRGAVRFAGAARALLAATPGAVCLEVAPHPVLGGYLASLGAGPVLAPLRRPARGAPSDADGPAFLGALGTLTTLGHSTLDFAALNNHADIAPARALARPYPFAPKAVPFRAAPPRPPRKGALCGPGLRVGAGAHAVLAQHVVKGEPIMPAAGFLEMALQRGARVLWGVEFRALLSLAGERAVPVEVSVDGIRWAVKTVGARGAGKEEAVFDRVHAEGYMALEAPSAEYAPVDVQGVMERCARVDLTTFYEDLKTFAEYGPAFQRVVDAFQGPDEALVLVRGPDALLDTEGFVFHPAILDCCLHFMVHRSFTLSADPNVYYLPARVGRLVLHTALGDEAFPEHVYAHIVFRRWTPEGIVADFAIVASDGTRLCTLTDVEVARHESAAGEAVAQRYDVALQPLGAGPPAAPAAEDVVVPGSAVDMRALHTHLDYLASQVIARTLAAAPRAGSTVDRARYRAFAEGVAGTARLDEATVREVEARWPEMVEVTARLAGVHAQIFETSKAAVEVLYKDDIMTRFYRHYDWAAAACARRFRAVVEGLVRAGKRVIRVLEVGAGTGALTRHLAEVMGEFPAVVIEFVVSDVSKELLPRMAYPRCSYRSFDIARPAEDQGLELASFDVITGFHVLHVVQEMVPSLAELNRLLVPGGRLLIGDLDGASFAARAPGAVWFDFVFGSFAEWFAFTDGRAHCTMSSREWRTCLASAGFGNVVAAAFAADPLLFTLEAQKLGPANVPRPAAPHRERLLFQYARGSEGELRAELAACDAGAPRALWLFAAAGLAGDAGAGLARSLAREYALWDVHFVVFDGAWTALAQGAFVAQLARTPTAEALLVVAADGTLSVPRVVPAPAPSRQRPFQPALPWVASGSEVVQTSAPRPSAETVVVRVLAMSPPEMQLRGFVGRVVAPAAAHALVAGDLVVGVACAPGFSNFVAVHHASVAPLPASEEPVAAQIAGAALGAVIGSLACGTAVLRPARRARSGKALLSHLGPVVGPALRWFLQLLGMQAVEAKHDSPAEIAALGLQFDFVFSGSDSRADAQGYERVLARGGRLFMWNDPRGGLAALLKDDPLAVGEALDNALARVAGRWPRHDIGVWLSDVSLPETGTLVPSSASLFDPAKSYVLVGGIGGLGIRIALWMYERGARYLVLTSRSGRDTLARVQDRLALRIVAYLESLPDLTLRLEASDATSHDSTAALLRSIPAQLGGCMLLSVVLSDRTFALQDNNDFDKVFASKTGACRVFEKCLPLGIASLDFFVGFSSVVGLFGNGGQTNYSSANTALDGIMRDWDNAFTFVLPAISDSGGLASETREHGGRLGHLTPWGMSAQRICDCLEDGIRKLADGPFWQYIPDLDWPLVKKYMGSAPLYSHLIDSNTEDGGPSHTEEAGKSLQDVVMELLDVDADEFSEDVPFTAYGLDSLSAARLSLALRPYVAISQLQLLSDISLSDLEERALAETAREEEPAPAPSPSPPPTEKKPERNPRVAEVEDMIAKYTRGFKTHAGAGTCSPVDGEVVLVTGTTGAIGTAVLARLAAMPSVVRVYAFNRASAEGSMPLRERQAASFEARGYDSRVLDRGKIVLVEGDQSVDNLRISSALYNEIRDSVTSIIHNAWPVNFTASLASLEPAVRSVRVLIDLALGSSRRVPPRLLFLSSIGLFYNRKGSSSAPEESIADVNQVIGTGYSESKYVGERILERAAEDTPLRPVVVRAGQICGGLNGSWSTTEWFPSLVKSSIHLRCLPEMQGDISWLPLHTAAESLVDMRGADRRTLHLSHPRPVSGSLISEFLSKALNLPLVPYAEWLTRLQKSAGEGRSQTGVGANPALGLLDYFRSLEVGSNASKEALGLPKLSVVEGENASSSLRDAEPLKAEDAAQWLTSWEKAGFLAI